MKINKTVTEEFTMVSKLINNTTIATCRKTGLKVLLNEKNKPYSSKRFYNITRTRIPGLFIANGVTKLKKDSQYDIYFPEPIASGEYLVNERGTILTGKNIVYNNIRELDFGYFIAYDDMWDEVVVLTNEGKVVTRFYDVESIRIILTELDVILFLVDHLHPLAVSIYDRHGKRLFDNVSAIELEISSLEIYKYIRKETESTKLYRYSISYKDLLEYSRMSLKDYKDVSSKFIPDLIN